MKAIRQIFSWATAVVFLALYSAGAFTAYAQGIVENWSAQTPGANGKMIGLDADNNVFVTGSFAPTATPITVVKYDPNGGKLWQQTFDAPTYQEDASWLAVDPFGNVIVTGHQVTGSNYNPVGLITVKYDANGNFLWSDIVSNPRGKTVRCETDAAGNIYVIGRVWITNSSGNTTDDFITIKYAPNGTKLWTQTITESSYSVDNPNALAIAPDGKVVVTGSAGPGVFFTVLYDANGNLIWRNNYNGSAGGNDVAFGPNGEVFVVGGSWTQSTSNVFAVVKYAANGSQEWDKFYTAGDIAYRIRVDSQGNLVITGIDQQGYTDWMTIKLNAAGNQLWSQRQNTHNSNDEIPYFMVLDPADAIYITGQGGPGPPSGNVSYLRMVTLKYSPNGAEEWVASTFTAAKGVGVRVGSGNKVYVLGEYQTLAVGYTQTTQIPPPPTPPPSNLTAAAISFSQINLAWLDNSTTESGFAIERCAGSGCTNFVEIARTGSNTTRYNDIGLAGGTTYVYRIRAFNNGGTSAYSNTATATTQPPPPPPLPPSNLTATMLSASSIQLLWTDNAFNEHLFHVERCQGTSCTNFAEIAQVGLNTTTYVDNGLPINTTYVYRVRASNSGGYSAYSNSASATTQNPCSNIALGKTATASNSSGNNKPNLAVDGNANTFWRSSSGGTQYLQIDLGAGALNYSQATIKWRSTRFAKSFQIRVSNNANFSTFTTVFNTTTGSGGNQTLPLTGAPRTERYIRLHMTKVNSSYYAVNEFEVYGSSSNALSKQDAEVIIPTEMTLQQNYPNPFNPSTNIRFSLPTEANVTLKIFNLIGEEVAILVDGVRNAGVHTVIFEAKDLPSGVYFSVLQTGEMRLVRRLVLMK